MSRNAVIQHELDQLLREGLLDAATRRQLSQLYPVSRWDWRSLARWLLIFGAVSAAAGAVTLIRALTGQMLPQLACLLTLLSGGLFWAGWKLKTPGSHWSRLAVELLGGVALLGLSFVLEILLTSPPRSLPDMLLLDLAILLLLSYGLNNILLLILSAVVFFVWFGGETGYQAGWNAYWFGMNGPLRFLGASAAIALMGYAHRLVERGPLSSRRGFSKVWLSFGVFLAEMSLWLLSIFGNDKIGRGIYPPPVPTELVLFNGLWTALNLTLMLAGHLGSHRLLKGYSATFLIIQAYTQFFIHLAPNLGWIGSLLLAGGSALALAWWLEAVRTKSRPPTQSLVRNEEHPKST